MKPSVSKPPPSSERRILEPTVEVWRPEPGAAGPSTVDWSNRVAELLLRFPPVAAVERQLSPTIDRGRLDRTDALAGLIRYGLMGGFATLVYLGTALALHGAGVGPNVTSAIAIMVSVAVSFVVQSRVTFRSGRFDAFEAARFGVVGIIGLTTSRAAVEVVHLRAGQPFWLAALVVCVVVPVANFMAMNFWVFGRRGDDDRR